MSIAVENRLLAKLARRHGPKIVEQAIGQLMDVGGVAKRAAKPSLGRRFATAALLRVATKSVPGAIIVGGGLIVKALHESRKAKRDLYRSGKAGK